MSDPSANHPPPKDFFQTPAVASKAIEYTVLGILCELERKKLLRADDVFDSLSPLTSGQNGAHEIGLTLGFFRRTVQWLIQNAPSKKSG